MATNLERSTRFVEKPEGRGSAIYFWLILTIFSGGGVNTNLGRLRGTCGGLNPQPPTNRALLERLHHLQPWSRYINVLKNGINYLVFTDFMETLYEQLINYKGKGVRSLLGCQIVVNILDTCTTRFRNVYKFEQRKQGISQHRNNSGGIKSGLDLDFGFGV